MHLYRSYTHLSPYTTLFRSWAQHLGICDLIELRELRALELRPDDPLDAEGDVVGSELGAVVKSDVAADVELHMRVVGIIDRKSTRLKSSHLGISYAVFCLKN